MINLQALSQQQAASELIARRAGRNSLIGFTKYTKPEFETAKHHEIICNALERVELGHLKRLMIFAPPRHTKSELASRRFPAWFLGKNPKKQLITCTYSGEFATDFGRDVREIVQSEECQRLFPDLALAADSQAKGRWHTTAGGVYVAVGVGGSITGRGAHIALIDDPVKNRQDADSKIVQDSIWKWYNSTLRTRLMPGGAIIIVLTRWHENDLAGKLLEAQKNGGEQWEVINLPAISKDNKALWPEWYDIDELTRIKSAFCASNDTAREWFSLYQQEPTAEDGIIFRREWFRLRGEPPSNLRKVICGDYAVTKDGGDSTDIGVFAFGDGKFYISDWWHGKESPDTWIDALIDLGKLHKPLFSVAETGVIKLAIEPLIKRMMSDRQSYIALDWESHNGADKVSNVRAFQAMCAQGLVIFPETEWAERVIDQLLKFTGAKNGKDDAVDACGIFGRWMDRNYLSKETTKIQPKRRDYGYNEDEGVNWKTA